jgi:hypothetical protein
MSLTRTDTWKWIEDFSHSVNLPRFPSILHCRGDAKLLGRNFALVLEEYLGGDEFDVAHIKEISSVARSWLIIDDYIRDTRLNGEEEQSVSELLNKIEAEVLAMGPRLDPNFSAYWKKVRQFSKLLISVAISPIFIHIKSINAAWCFCAWTYQTSKLQRTIRYSVAVCTIIFLPFS